MADDDLRLDDAPMQPPNVSSVMGAGAEGGANQGIADMIRKKAAGGGPQDFASVAQAHPQGALITRIEAVKKVLSETARMGQVIGPYCNRAMEILTTGLAEELKMQKPGIVPNQQPPASGGPGPSMRPPTGDAAKSFVG
jgi:hypothetical protein